MEFWLDICAKAAVTVKSLTKTSDIQEDTNTCVTEFNQQAEGHFKIYQLEVMEYSMQP